MPNLAEYCDQLCQHFSKLLELAEDQAGLYGEVRSAIQAKAWSPLEQNLKRMEFLAREQGRVSKQILALRIQLQQQLNSTATDPAKQAPQLLKIGELLSLLPEPKRSHLRKVWQDLRDSLVRRQSELQVLEHYSREKQQMIEGFLSALKDDELDRGQVYGRAGSQYQSAAAPSRIFNGEA